MPNTPNKEMILKARIIGDDVDAPSSHAEDDPDNMLFASTGGVIEPPLDPKTLIRIWENSSSLNQNVDAYITNIDGTGHRLEPVIDFQAQDVKEQVREALWVQASLEASEGEMPPLPSDDEVEDAMDELKRKARFEELRFGAFIRNVNPDGSFVSLRRKTRQDLEITGNAYWEVLRNKKGEVARFVKVAVTSMRMTIVDDNPVEVEDKVPFGALGFDTVKQHRFFRRFVQSIQHGRQRKAVWFKEYGDARVVSRRTGKVFADLESFEAKKQEGDQPATEVLHWKIDTPGSPYGTPRWIGNLLAVLGSRAADEVNYNYFDNKAIPPLALLIAGGSLGEDDVSRIETYINDNIKGRNNFHKILIIEANGDEQQQIAGQASIPTIKFERLMSEQVSDALFQKYDQNNIDKVGSSFRMPKLMRGDIRDFNRATALAALRFAEEQVFEPERLEFDDIFQRQIVVALDISMWTFRSNSINTRDIDTLSPALAEQLRAGSIVANEARPILADALGRDLPPIDAPWANLPLPVVLQILGKDTVDSEGDLDLKSLGGKIPKGMSKDELMKFLFGEEQEEVKTNGDAAQATVQS